MRQSLDSISINPPLVVLWPEIILTDRGKLGTKIHVLTEREGIPLSAVIPSASIHDLKAVTDVIDNAVIKQYKRGYTPHISYKINRLKKEETAYQNTYSPSKNKRWIVERTNSWYNKFIRLFIG